MQQFKVFVIGLLAGASLTAAFSLTLQGKVSNAEGRCGFRMNESGGINYVHPDSPAEHAGIHKGDKVVSVDGKKRAFGDITGAPGTPVALEIKRGAQLLKFTIERIDHREIKP